MSRLDRFAFRSFRFSVALAGLALVWVSMPIRADWLVTTEGERIETQGPWKVEGRRIVYTQVNGTLSAVRASSIDLEASEKATRKANEPKPPPVVQTRAQPKKAALVLDQSSVGTHRAAPVAPATDVTEDSLEAEKEAAESAGDVVVTSWEETQTLGDELRIEGVVRNDSRNFATNITLEVTTYDPDGNPSGTKQATLGKKALATGARTTFTVDFPGLFLTNGVTFKVTNRSFLSRKADETNEDDSQPPTDSDTPDGKR